MSQGISVIIPVYNCADFLAEAIESVLAQTYLPIEIIVVDDGSTDSSVSVAMSFAPGVRVLTQPNGGPSSARKLGVRSAVGSHLAFLDADDLWMPDKLRMQMDAMSGGGYDMVFGRVEVFRELGDGKLQVYDGTHAGTMLVKREAYDRVGEFADGVRIGDFMEWYGRAADSGLRSISLPEVVMRRRLHHHNMTKGEDTRTGYFDVLREAIRRRSGT